MEDSLCVAESTGWAPRYLVAYEGGSPRGALVMFRKLNSHGEFIFDFAWADASHRAGLRYYPKHIVASPFSPVGGPRFLILPDVDPAPLRAALITAAMRLSRAEGGSGLHFLFVTPDEATALEAQGESDKLDYGKGSDVSFEDVRGIYADKPTPAPMVEKLAGKDVTLVVFCVVPIDGNAVKAAFGKGT